MSTLRCGTTLVCQTAWPSDRLVLHRMQKWRNEITSNPTEFLADEGVEDMQGGSSKH